MKSTILLAFGLFLASAPSPDAQSVSEMSAGFLSPDPSNGLMAAEFAVSTRHDLDRSLLLAMNTPCDQAGDDHLQTGTRCATKR